MVQQMINENADFLTKEQLEQHVSRLNRDDFQALETEWEVAVLNAFSKIGRVQHEPSLDGSSRLDLLFVNERDEKAQFIADVATVSDEGLEKETPVKAFEIELIRRIKKAKLRANSFGFTINSYSKIDGKRENIVKLMIPKKGEFAQEIFNKAFNSFLNQIQQNPNSTRKHHISTAKTNVEISYNPGQKFLLASMPNYRRAPSKTQNAIYNALKSKAKQVKRISYRGSKGMIICNGGTNIGTAGPINEFLRQNQSIDFILYFSSVWTDADKFQPYGGRLPVRKIQAKLFTNKNFNCLPVSIKNSLAKIEKCFPEPQNTAEGARETIRRQYDPKKFRHMGGYRVNSNEIKISANAVLGLLAGVITQEEFCKSLGFNHPGGNNPDLIRNPFESFLIRQKKIIDIQVENTPHDDDSLIFKFKGPDPAISAFINPKSKKV